MTNAVNIAQGGSNNTTMRNRIINGAMVIDQRNSGASFTNTAGTIYTLDRWQATGTQASKFTVQQNAGSVTPPTGFSNYIGVTSSSAYSVTGNDYFSIAQIIEGFNTADLGFGTANAKTVTLSFWVRSSLTGSFGGSIENGAQNRCFSFAYTISAANTWTQISVTVSGDTSGTWVGATNGSGVYVWFGLGASGTRVGTAGSWGTQSASGLQPSGTTSVVGTSGATFYITGVQLEAGTTASPFEYRQYGTELALCQRYLPALVAEGTFEVIGVGQAYSTTAARVQFKFPVDARTAPTGATFTLGAYQSVTRASADAVAGSSASFIGAGIKSAWIDISGASGLVAGNATMGFLNNASAKILFTGSEL
jgi:hypothetical protein